MISHFIVFSGLFVQLFYNGIAPIVVGKFIYGLGLGGYYVLTGKFIMEFCSKSIAGQAGATMGIAFSAGVMIGSIITALSPKDLFDVENNAQNSITMHYINTGTPMVMCAIQASLMWFVFKYDTPIMYRQNKEEVLLREALGKLYTPKSMNAFIEDIPEIFDENQTKDAERGLDSLKHSKLSDSIMKQKNYT